MATIRVPVSRSGEGEGKPPTISFAPRYLAEALAIGSTLRLIDGISPGVATDSSGSFCVVMACRLTEVAEDAGDNAAGPTAAAPAIAA